MINVGFYNYVAKEKVVAVFSPDSNYIRLNLARKKENNELVDLSSNRKRRSVILTTSGDWIISAVATRTLLNRLLTSKGEV